MMNFNSLSDVFKEQIDDLHSAEQQLIDALPKMASAANSPELRTAFENHLQETRGHLQRLDDIISSLGLPAPTETCKGMQGLIAEGQDILQASGDTAAKDAALIAAAQRVEHYEIAAYGTARTLADNLGYSEERDLLDETLDEEAAADKKLTKIATGGLLKSGVNQAAAR
jgi:ferritin-like metal-binding protein YciE